MDIFQLDVNFTFANCKPCVYLSLFFLWLSDVASMRWRDVIDPVHALGQGVVGCRIVSGKVVNETHDACGAGTALTAGN